VSGTVPAAGSAAPERSGEAPAIGVLALQGDFALHQRTLERLGVSARQVRTAAGLEGLGGLILPGGESTAMLKLMEKTGLEDALRAFHAGGGALFGTCAGLILLARTVTGPVQRSLGILDAAVVRNGYGRQVDSFETDLAWTEDHVPVRGVFIRAPRIEQVGKGVRVLATVGEEPVLVREDRVLAATFHPELTEDTRLHRYFLEDVVGMRRARSRVA
jgi:5'-phosphate synthase pdxT subunit